MGSVFTFKRTGNCHHHLCILLPILSAWTAHTALIKGKQFFSLVFNYSGVHSLSQVYHRMYRLTVSYQLVASWNQATFVKLGQGHHCHGIHKKVATFVVFVMIVVERTSHSDKGCRGYFTDCAIDFCISVHERCTSEPQRRMNFTLELKMCWFLLFPWGARCPWSW